MPAKDDQREVQRLARKMASSGQFPNCESIEQAIGRAVGEAVQWIGSRGFRRQIDRICAIAFNAGARSIRRSSQ